MRIKKYTAFLLFSLISPLVLAEEEVGITPYRPSVSSPAQLPLAGQLEMELGSLRTKSDTLRRDSVPVQFKLAFNSQWGVLLGGEAYVSTRDNLGVGEHGAGDLSVVLKRAFVMDAATAFGLELGTKLPTAKDTIGSGKTDYSLNAIFSKDLGKVHMDTNLNFTRLGAVDAGTSSAQTGLSASFSLPLSDKWGATTEISGTHRSGTGNTAQLLAALAYSPNKRMTIDVGLAKGLNDATPNWSVFGGIVIPVAKLW